MIFCILGGPPQYWGLGTSVTWSLGTISETLNMPLPTMVLTSFAHASALVLSLDGTGPPAACSTMSLRIGVATQSVATHLKQPAGCWSLTTKVWSSGAERPRPFRKPSIADALLGSVSAYLSPPATVPS